MKKINRYKLISALARVVDDSITLYHGTNNKFDRIKEYSGSWVEFGGIFASPSREAAESHGEYLYSIKLKKSDVLTQQDLEYHLDPNRIKKVLIYEADLESDSPTYDEDLDLLWRAVVENNEDQERLKEIFKEDLEGEASWKCQAIRGKIAKAFGYKAVEMNDEHGTSYLVLPGNPIQEIT